MQAVIFGLKILVENIIQLLHKRMLSPDICF